MTSENLFLLTYNEDNGNPAFTECLAMVDSCLNLSLSHHPVCAVA